jgi:hypothetical protein
VDYIRPTTALLWLFVTVLGTSALGYLVHRVARSSISNGAWDALPESRKRIIGASGIFASALAGFSGIYLAPTPQNLDEFIRVLSGILVAQILAGWGGSEAIRRWQKGRDE